MLECRRADNSVKRCPPVHIQATESRLTTRVTGVTGTARAAVPCDPVTRVVQLLLRDRKLTERPLRDLAVPLRVLGGFTTAVNLATGASLETRADFRPCSPDPDCHSIREC